MRTYYLSPWNLRAERRTTNRTSDVRFCRSLARNGASVQLIGPAVRQPGNVEARGVREHHGITETMDIKTLPTPLWDGAPPWIRAPIWFAAVFVYYVLEATRQGERFAKAVWISRDHNAVLAILVANRLLGRRGAPVVYWAHQLRLNHRRLAWIYRRVDGVLATNSAILEDLERTFGVSRRRTAVTLHPMNPELLDVRPSKEEARSSLGIEDGTPLVVYTGKLGYQITEPRYIIEAAAMLPEIEFVFTGGTADSARHWDRWASERGAENVRCTGFLADPRDVRNYQVAADVLVSYYTSERKLLDYDFPQKVAEYMASGTPIVTLNARATRDVLSPENAFFVEPHSSQALAAGIRAVLEDEAAARARAERAYRVAQSLTLDERGAAIVAFLERIRTRE